MNTTRSMPDINPYPAAGSRPKAAWLLLAVAFFLFLPAAPIGATALEHEAGFYYTVQEGDTLWEISHKFADNPEQWPELWQNNHQVHNPHRIFPGQKLRILRKKGVTRIELPPAPVEPPPMAEETPPAPEPEKPFYFYSRIDGTGYMIKEPVFPVARLFKSRHNKKLVSEGDQVYLRTVGDQQMVIGGRYTLFRPSNPLRMGKKRRYIGNQQLVTGVLEVVQIEPEYVIAEVWKGFRAIRVGDLALPYAPRSPKITIQPSVPELTGRIIIGEERVNNFAEDSVAFIDRGRTDGVKPGQYYDVFRQERTRPDPVTGEYTVFPRINFARLLVLHAQETTSTVLVTNSEVSLHPGDRFRAPTE